MCLCSSYLVFVVLVRKFLQGDLVDSFHEPLRQTLLQISVKFNLHVIDNKMLRCDKMDTFRTLCSSVSVNHNKGGVAQCYLCAIKEAWPLSC